MISGLSPDNEYSIKIQAFNTAGESDFSNSVVKRTLGKCLLYYLMVFSLPLVTNKYNNVFH